MTSKYTPRVGQIWLRAYDEGVITRLGAALGTGTSANNYFVNFPIGSCMNPAAPLNVPVIWSSPEQLFEKKTYPAYLIKRESIEPALERWGSVGAIQQVWGVPGTENGSNYNKTELEVQAWPYNISYTITIYARYEYEAQTLLMNLLKRFPPYGYITVKDSLNDNRTYECLAVNAIQDLSEIVDVSERLKSYSHSIQVLGEIDVTDPVIVDTVLTVDNNIQH
jgi:hypothetical protein